MFAVLFDARPDSGEPDTYLNYVRQARECLADVEGFINVTAYRSVVRDGWFLSLSRWADERALVRWRVHPRHHEYQQLSRGGLLGDYRVRVGHLADDPAAASRPALHAATGFETTESGSGAVMTLIAADRPLQWIQTDNPAECAEWIGFDPFAEGLLGWDLFEAIEPPNSLLLTVAWRDEGAADEFEGRTHLPDGGRFERLCVLRDYSMIDRREAPVYYPAISSIAT